MKPLVVINFKTYKETVGKKAISIAKSISKVRKNGYDVAIAPSLLTTKEITEKVNIPVYAQHCSLASLGANTGRITVAELKNIGVKGTILNHSERKIPMKFLAHIVKACKEKKLKTIVCASDMGEIKKIAPMKPDYIAYEPKELIGSNISVTEAKPEIILKAVELVKRYNRKTKVLCGAGVHSREDLGHALLLGTEGVLIGHSVSKARDPKKFLEGMLL
jgi:triosephosphate isomerase (TIM)